MTIFVVFDTGGGECEFKGAFSTHEKAEQYCESNPQSKAWLAIEEVRLDALLTQRSNAIPPAYFHNVERGVVKQQRIPPKCGHGISGIPTCTNRHSD